MRSYPEEEVEEEAAVLTGAAAAAVEADADGRLPRRKSSISTKSNSGWQGTKRGMVW